MSAIGSNAEQTPRPVRRCRVLAVDDNVDILESLSVVIDLLGHDVRTAVDGGTALAAGREFAPHLVLLDVGLPGMSGYEVATLIRAEEWGRRAVLVAVTGWAREEDGVLTQRSGFDVHVIKPVDLRLLLTLIDRALRGGGVADAPG